MHINLRQSKWPNYALWNLNNGIFKPKSAWQLTSIQNCLKIFSKYKLSYLKHFGNMTVLFASVQSETSNHCYMEGTALLWNQGTFINYYLKIPSKRDLISGKCFDKIYRKQSMITEFPTLRKKKEKKNFGKSWSQDGFSSHRSDKTHGLFISRERLKSFSKYNFKQGQIFESILHFSQPDKHF